jgi:formylglycine-generating enzyme required for sulfatase activity
LTQIPTRLRPGYDVRRESLSITHVAGWLAELLSRGALPPKERACAGAVLTRLGDPRPGVGLGPDGLPAIDWVEVPAGPFPMGSTSRESPWDDERPGFECRLIRKPYRIARYPITVAQYQAFVDAKGYEERRFWTQAGWTWRKKEGIGGPEDYSPVFQTLNHPRGGVSWFEAVAFCRWLSERLKEEVRLPSEAEWERAARHTDRRKYPWGNAEEEYKERCNMSDTGIGHTSPVGMFPGGDSPCGAADMAGNVYEWCRTKWIPNYEDYERRADDDPEGGKSRALRGGAFFDSLDSVRCAFRFWNFPVYRYRNFGFRVVASPFSSGL